MGDTPATLPLDSRYATLQCAVVQLQVVSTCRIPSSNHLSVSFLSPFVSCLFSLHHLNSPAKAAQFAALVSFP
jgi:hypothetical protein